MQTRSSWFSRYSLAVACSLLNRLSNAGNARTAALLLNNLEAIEAFTTHPEAGFLLLRPEALSS
jgi:hypothetical protein